MEKSIKNEEMIKKMPNKRQAMINKMPASEREQVE
jgi:hypothetical protein